MRSLYFRPTLTALLCLFLLTLCVGQAYPGSVDQRITVVAPGNRSLVLELQEIDLLSKSVRLQYPKLHAYRVITDGVSGVITMMGTDLIADISLRGSRYNLSQSVSDPQSGYRMVKKTGNPELAASASICEEESTVTSGLLKKSLHPLENTDRLTIGQQQRTYKIVIAPTLEFVRSNGGTNASAAVAVTNTLAYASTVFKKDLAVNLILNGILSYPDGATEDDFVPDENREDIRLNLAAKVIAQEFAGSDYDLGMVFHNTNLTTDFSSGAAASIGVVCSNVNRLNTALSPKKGAGWSGFGDNTAPEWNWYVTHELGHMFGARHTFNGLGGSCTEFNVSPSSAVEIGSGTTIMGYYDLCGAAHNIDFDLSSNNYFHQVSLAEISDYLSTIDCGTTGTSDNSPPVVEANPCGNDEFTIPKGTAFELRGVATDADDDILTYAWEQIDEDGASNPSQGATLSERGQDGKTAAYSSSAPLFRNFAPGANPVRTFPGNPNGLSSAFEVLPEVARKLRFGLVVRDNAGVTGGVSLNATEVEVASAGPLLFAGPNAGEELRAGNAYTFNWQNNGSEALCDEVIVQMSLDGGTTYPYTLGTANYAEEKAEFTIPAATKDRSNVRFRLRCDDSPCRTFFAVDQQSRSIRNETCVAINSRLPAEEMMSFESSSGSAQLQLTPDLPLDIGRYPEGTIDASKTERLPTTYYRNPNRAGECDPAGNSVSTDVIYVSTSVTGQYRVDAPRQGKVRSVLTVYQDVFNADDGCANWVTSSRATGSNVSENGLTLVMEAGRQYIFTVAPVDQRSLEAVGGVFDYDIGFNLQQGEGSPIYTDRPSPSIDYNYTYVAVEEPTRIIRDVDDNANFDGLASGTYEVYGINYPSSIDESEWNGSALSTVLASGDNTECLALSDNFRSINVVSAQVAAPVEWITFTAFYRGAGIVLDWSVATEVDNDYFAVLRSEDGSNWETIGRVNGRGTSLDRGDYVFTDARPLPGLSYYRLTQVDYDGSSGNSAVVAVQGAVVSGDASIYPNPFTASVTVSWEESPAIDPVLFDVTGKDVSDQIIISRNPGSAALETHRLAAGVYFLRWGEKTLRLIKK